ncbi:bark storage protein A [Euphorbia lathyris]|uniref:bark storage protein A n=1 Tax=Euphorbia lathyris TaxID=212925 RepID=UPI0033136046
MLGHLRLLLLVFLEIGILSNGEYLSKSTMEKIAKINKKGPYLGIVVPNAFEMNPLLQSSSFLPTSHLDFSGRRFRIGEVENVKVIIVMTGLSMLNAGVSTELLLSLFKVKGVVHYGIAGNANPSFQIGDVTIPQFWAHTGLWVWQRDGDDGNDELPLESNKDYTRKIGFLRFSDYNDKNGEKPVKNMLNNVWYQPEEIFPVNGIPEVRQRVFWVPVDRHYFKIAKKLQGVKLSACVNSTNCLPRTPVVVRVKNGISGNIFVDNSGYREFLSSKFNATPVDMESAAVALICYQQRTPFIAIRSLSDLAGGGSAISNESDMFSSLAAQNAVLALLKFISLLYA